MSGVGCFFSSLGWTALHPNAQKALAVWGSDCRVEPLKRNYDPWPVLASDCACINDKKNRAAEQGSPVPGGKHERDDEIR